MWIWLRKYWGWRHNGEIMGIDRGYSRKTKRWQSNKFTNDGCGMQMQTHSDILFPPSSVWACFTNNCPHRWKNDLWCQTPEDTIYGTLLKLDMQVELQMLIDMVPNANVWICNCIWLSAGMMKSCSPRLTFKSLMPKLSIQIFISSDSSEPEASSKPQSKGQVHAQIPLFHLKVSRFSKAFLLDIQSSLQVSRFDCGFKGAHCSEDHESHQWQFQGGASISCRASVSSHSTSKAALVQSAVDWSHAWCCTKLFFHRKSQGHP